jgi:hypothetical protein
MKQYYYNTVVLYILYSAHPRPAWQVCNVPTTDDDYRLLLLLLRRHIDRINFTIHLRTVHYIGVDSVSLPTTPSAGPITTDTHNLYYVLLFYSVLSEPQLRRQNDPFVK